LRTPHPRRPRRPRAAAPGSTLRGRPSLPASQLPSQLAAQGEPPSAHRPPTGGERPARSRAPRLLRHRRSVGAPTRPATPKAARAAPLSLRLSNPPIVSPLPTRGAQSIEQPPDPNRRFSKSHGERLRGGTRRNPLWRLPREHRRACGAALAGREAGRGRPTFAPAAAPLRPAFPYLPAKGWPLATPWPFPRLDC
jgi:hypothetical protein